MKLRKLFESLVKMEELEVLEHCKAQLLAAGYTVISCDEMWVLGQPKEPAHVALVAHCDTVAKKPPTTLHNAHGVISVKGGGVLGADDRAGVAAILHLLEQGARPLVYFTNGEETGAKGAHDLAVQDDDCKPTDDIRVLIQIDRQGANDYVTYDCASLELNAWVESFGFEESVGSFSDISVLAPAFGIAAANVSCGYYNQHTKGEYLQLPVLAHTIYRLRAMIANPPAERIVYEEHKPIYYSLGKGWPDRVDVIKAAERTYDGYDDWINDGAPSQDEKYQCQECSEKVGWFEYDAAYGLCEDCAKLFKLH